MVQGPMTILRDRARWGGYGFVAGIVLGLILGWAFHGIVSVVMRFFFVALLLVPLVVVFLVWRRLTSRDRRETVVTRSVVVDDPRWREDA